MFPNEDDGLDDWIDSITEECDVADETELDAIDEIMTLDGESRPEADEKLYDKLFIAKATAEEIELLFNDRARPNPDLTDADNMERYPRTILTRLVCEGRYEQACVLLKNGANPNLVIPTDNSAPTTKKEDCEPVTPDETANETKSIHPLAAICNLDLYGTTPKDTNRVAMIVDELLNAGAVSYERDEEGRTPLEHAVNKALTTFQMAAIDPGYIDESARAHYEGVVTGLSQHTAVQLSDIKLNPSESLRTAIIQERNTDNDNLKQILLRVEQVIHHCGVSRTERNGEFTSAFIGLVRSPHKSFDEMQDQMRHYTVEDVLFLRDVIDEFCTYVLIPAMYLRASDANKQKLLKLESIEVLKARLRPIALEVLFRGKSIDSVFGISKGWHQPRYFFPQHLRPLRSGTWYKLTDDQFINDGNLKGVSIACLNSSDQLKQEGDAMLHCIGGMDKECLDGDRHVYSIRDSDGERLSTFDVSVLSMDQYREEVGEGDNDEITDRDNFIIVDSIEGPVLQLNEHRAESNDQPSQKAWDVFKWFKQQIQDGVVNLHLNEKGETIDSVELKRNREINYLEKAIGFRMELGDINAAFDHFKSIKGKRPKEDGTFKDTKDRLVSGNYQPLDSDGKPNGGPQPLRTLSLSEWVEKKGIDQALDKVLNN